MRAGRFNYLAGPLCGYFAVWIPIKPGETKQYAERRARIPADFEGIIFFQDVE